MQPSRLKFIKIKPICRKGHHFFFRLCNSTLIRKKEFRGLCLKSVILTILTSSFSYYLYQNDQWVKPWNLPVKWHPFYHSFSRQYNVSHLPFDFSFHLSSTTNARDQMADANYSQNVSITTQKQCTQ